MFQNGGQKGPKMLGRNWENQLWDHFGDLKQAWWSQRRLHKASTCSFWPPFHPIWTSVSVIFDLQSSPHSSINELCCPRLVYQTSEHTAGFNVYHSLFTLSDSHSAITFHTLVRCRCFRSSHWQESATPVLTIKAWRSTYHQLITQWNYLRGNHAFVLIVECMTSLDSSNNCKKTHSRNKRMDLYHLRTR